jgi:hypothetical protein
MRPTICCISSGLAIATDSVVVAFTVQRKPIEQDLLA